MVQLLWKTVWQFITKPSIYFPHGAATALLSIYPKENLQRKLYLHKNVYRSFVTTKPWKKINYLLKGEFINWYIHTMIFYSAIRRNALLTDAITPSDLLGFILR
jgi:hypothetical protein